MNSINIGDDVTINAVIVDVTESGNYVVKLKKGGKVLVCPDEVNTVRPKVKTDGVDKRKGN